MSGSSFLIESGKVYLLRDLHVRIWAGVKVSTTVDSVVSAIVDEDIQKILVRQDEIQTDNYTIITVPIIAFVQKVETSIACRSCLRRLLQSTDSKFVHCDRCGSTLKIADCRPQVCAKVVVESSEGDQLDLTIFQNVLQSVIEGGTLLHWERKSCRGTVSISKCKDQVHHKHFCGY
jgi:ribosomal protein L37AE/L43A